MTEQEFDQKFSKAFKNAREEGLEFMSEQMKMLEEESHSFQDPKAFASLIAKITTVSLNYSTHLIHDALKEFFVESET